MASGGNTIYFDSCIYLAHYKQEIDPYGPTRISAIGEVWKDCDAGDVKITTSAISICEVIDQLLTSGLTEAIEDFKNKFKTGMHTLIDVDPGISEKAAEYRNHYRKYPVVIANKIKKFVNLTTPDALHLATAVTYGVTEFWTFDGLSSKVDKQESIKLLWLGNKVAKDSLIITPPMLPQGTLLLVPAQPPKVLPNPITPAQSA